MSSLDIAGAAGRGSDPVHVEHVRAYSDELLHGLNALVAQLSSSTKPLTESTLERLLACEGSSLWIARRHGPIVGTLCLIVFRCPTGTRGFIEDVVVDSSARRAGVAEALTRAAIAQAWEHGAKTIDLTCRPHRLAANALYRKLGFVVRPTNFHRLERPAAAP